MKKIFYSCLVVLGSLLLFSCSNNTKSTDTLSLNGVDYDSNFVKSGYYFDKASMSEASLGEMLEKVEVVEKPKILGEVVLPDFSTIELVNNKPVEITEELIEAEIEKERDMETTFTPVKVKREAKLTDKVIIDFKGYVNGEELEGGSGEDYELVLGSGSFIPGFEEKVVGHRAGQKFTIDVTFPEEYTEELAGKPATFDITIKSMEEAITPEFNDEFVVAHSTKSSKNVAEYKEEIKLRIADRNVFLNNQNLIYQLYDKLFAETKFTPTEEAKAWFFSVMIDQIKKQAEANGTNLSTILVSNGGTVVDAYNQIKSSVPELVQEEMLMNELTKKYNIELTEPEVKEWFERMSQLMGYGTQVNYDDYKTYMGYENLYNSAKQEKVLLSVVKECKVVDEVDENNESTD